MDSRENPYSNNAALIGDNAPSREPPTPWRTISAQRGDYRAEQQHLQAAPPTPNTNHAASRSLTDYLRDNPSSNGGQGQGPEPSQRTPGSNGPNPGNRNLQQNVRIRWWQQPEPDTLLSPRETGNNLEHFAAAAVVAQATTAPGPPPSTRGQSQEMSGTQSTGNSNSNGGSEAPPSTRIEDEVLDSIREIRSNYIYQYMPSLQLDFNEHFGINNPNIVSPFNVPPLTVPAPSAATQLTSRIRTLRLASEEVLMRLYQQPLPDSDVTSSDADESTPNPYPSAQFGTPGTATSSDVSTTPGPEHEPMDVVNVEQEINNLADRLSNALQHIQRALSRELESHVEAMGNAAAVTDGPSSTNQRNPVNATRGHVAFHQPERPDTSDSNSSNMAYDMEFAVWDAETNVHNLNIFMGGESVSSEEDYGGQRDNLTGGYGSIAALQALYNAATRDTGTSMQDPSLDVATLRERARERGRRPAFQVPRNVSPETREFYQSIGLPIGESDTTQNSLSGFISLENPRGWDSEMEKLLGKDTPVPLYDHEISKEDNDEPPDATNGEVSNDESSTATQINFVPDEALNENNNNSSSETGSTASSIEMDEDGTQTDSSGTESEEVEDIVLPNIAEITNSMSDNELMDMQLPINLDVTIIAELARITETMRANGINQQIRDRVLARVTELAKLVDTMIDCGDPNEPKPVDSGTSEVSEPDLQNYTEENVIQLPFRTVFSSRSNTEIKNEAKYVQLLENLTKQETALRAAEATTTDTDPSHSSDNSDDSDSEHPEYESIILFPDSSDLSDSDHRKSKLSDSEDEANGTQVMDSTPGSNIRIQITELIENFLKHYDHRHASFQEHHFRCSNNTVSIHSHLQRKLTVQAIRSGFYQVVKKEKQEFFNLFGINELVELIKFYNVGNGECSCRTFAELIFKNTEMWQEVATQVSKLLDEDWKPSDKDDFDAIFLQPYGTVPFQKLKQEYNKLKKGGGSDKELKEISIRATAHGCLGWGDRETILFSNYIQRKVIQIQADTNRDQQITATTTATVKYVEGTQNYPGKPLIIFIHGPLRSDIWHMESCEVRPSSMDVKQFLQHQEIMEQRLMDAASRNTGRQRKIEQRLKGAIPNDCNKAKPVASTTNRDFIQQALDVTNKHRQAHGAPPLTINEELCKISQAWVNRQAKTGQWEHSHLAKCGENMFMGTAKNYDGAKPVNAWYNEEKDYDYSKATFMKGTGHFTALVWKSTTQTCISMAKVSYGTIYIVAKYYPAGNMIGAFGSNVLPKTGGGGGDGDDPSSGRSGGGNGSDSTGAGHQPTLRHSTLVLATPVLILVYNY